MPPNAPDAAQLDPALWELLRSRGSLDDDEVEAIIRLDRPQVDVDGVRLVSRFGHIATCRIRKDSVLAVRHDENVESLKAPRVLGPEPEPYSADAATVPLSSAVDGDRRRPPDLSLTGAGVVVGFIDWGCDFDHSNFKHPDGSTRLLALWDQRGAPMASAPSPYGYGVLYTQQQINDALRTHAPYQELGYHPGDADRDQSGAHGTHVMDVAVGNGRGGGPIGIAPGADAVFVHLADRGTGGLANLGDSVRILEAIDFIARTAGRRPWVINLSVGRHGGPHDGCTLAELALDCLLGEAPDRFIVQSAGNYFERSTHASGHLAPGQVRSVTFITDEADLTPNEFEMWYSGDDEFVVRIEFPTGRVSPWVRLGERGELLDDGRLVGRIYHRARDPNNLDNHVEVFISPSAPAGHWEVTLKGTKIQNGLFHAWLERDEACARCQARFVEADADTACTTGTIANARLPLVVGAYSAHSPTREMAAFSSAGPTRDGRAKPDLIAPGVRVVAARSAPPGSPRSLGLLTRKSGTSMAAPHVTGAVALCLEGAHRPLAAEEIRELVLTTAEPMAAGQEPASRFGCGSLDVANLVAAASALGQPVTSRRPTPSVDAGRPRHDPKEATMDPQLDEATLASLSPDRLYSELLYGRGGRVSDWIDATFEVLARPGESPARPEAGDVLVRVALGEAGRGHVAVLSDSGLMPQSALDPTHMRSERGGSGLYATVIEKGASEHARSGMVARRVLDATGRMPQGQVLLRPKPSAVASWDPAGLHEYIYDGLVPLSTDEELSGRDDILDEEDIEDFSTHAAEHALVRSRMSQRLADERSAIVAAIASGQTNENELTNKVFFLRHPDREVRKLRPGEEELMSEWRDIRTRLVVPALLSGPQIGPVHKPGLPVGPDLRKGVPSNAILSPLSITLRGLRASRRSQPGTIAAVVVHMTSRGPAKHSMNNGYRRPAVEYALDHYINGMEGFPHYVIDFNGTIYAVCDERLVAAHAGWVHPGGAGIFAAAWTAPEWWSRVWSSHGAASPLDLLPSGSRSPNDRTIGIELLILPDLSYTPEQYRALARLVVDIQSRHSDLQIPAVPSRGLLGHEDFTPVTGKGGRADAHGGWDPGAHRTNPYFDWPRLASELQRLSFRPEPRSSPPSNPTSVELLNAPKNSADEGAVEWWPVALAEGPIEPEVAASAIAAANDGNATGHVLLRDDARHGSELAGQATFRTQQSQRAVSKHLATPEDAQRHTDQILEELHAPASMPPHQDSPFEHAVEEISGPRIGTAEATTPDGSLRVTLASYEAVPAQQCGFPDQGGRVLTLDEVREEIVSRAFMERGNWVRFDAQTMSPVMDIESLDDQFEHLVRYFLHLKRDIIGLNLTHIERQLLDHTITPANKFLRLLDPLNTAQATVDADARAIAQQFLDGAPVPGDAQQSQRLETSVVWSLTRARYSRLGNQMQANDQRQRPWSAAFVMTCVRSAELILNLESQTGAGRDVLSSPFGRHWEYVKEAHIRRFGCRRPNATFDLACARVAAYHAFEPAERAVRTGDIVVHDRRDVDANHVWRFDRSQTNEGDMHGDIVVNLATDGARPYAVTLGGNLGGSVKLRHFPLNPDGTLVVDARQDFRTEANSVSISGIPAQLANAPAGNLRGSSTRRIFALLSLVEECASAP